MSNQIKVTIATNIQSEVAGHSLVNLIKVECPPLLPIDWIDAVVPYDWLEERLGLNLPGYSLGAYLMESSEKNITQKFVFIKWASKSVSKDE